MFAKYDDDFQLIIAMILQSNMVLFLIFPNRFFWLGDAYFKHSVPSVDSSQRRRSPLATSLYWRLRSWRTSGSERQALQLWVHLVCIMHVGDPLFIEGVIFKQSALEPSNLASHFVDFLFGQTDDYTKKLAEGLLGSAPSCSTCCRLGGATCCAAGPAGSTADATDPAANPHEIGRRLGVPW